LVEKTSDPQIEGTPRLPVRLVAIVAVMKAPARRAACFRAAQVSHAITRLRVPFAVAAAKRVLMIARSTITLRNRPERGAFGIDYFLKKVYERLY
jgi:hypothetical protein